MLFPIKDMFSHEDTVKMQILFLILYFIYLVLICQRKDDNTKVFFKIIMYRFRNDECPVLFSLHIFSQEVTFEMPIVFRKSQF